MARILAVNAVTALCLLSFLRACPFADARPMPARPVSSGTSALALPPSAFEGAAHWRAADAAARAGKWLPYYRYAGGGGLHYHPGYPKYPGYPAEGKPMMWGSGTPPELGAYAASGRQLGKSPYGDETRREQVAMWASLLNPSKGPTTPTSWLPANGGDEPADQARDEPKAYDGAAEGTEMDVPPGGGGVQTAQQPKWGFYPGNKNGK
ncbi:hypothetical protein VPH35_092335 [Triticum aestivum]|uniref:uncharacterized protein n=1 Tax=Triticum aestivum TaxID=4565 RepID=UPI00194AA471|nr:uncharacterized protein LOC123116929 [Triticum aestivum]